VKRKIKEFNNYIIKNPKFKNISNTTRRDKLIISLNKIYRVIRSKFKFIFPLKDGQESAWAFSWRKSPDNSGANLSVKDPFYNVEYMHFFDIFPKEKYSKVIRGLRRFYFEHSENTMFDDWRADIKNPVLQDLEESSAWSSLCKFTVSEKSTLYNVAKSCSVRLINSTSSYCGIVFTVKINQELKRKLSEFMLSDVPERNEPIIPSDFKWSWKHIKRGVGVGSFSIKSNIFNVVLDDIAWQISNKVGKLTKSLVLQRGYIAQPYIVAVSTNFLGDLKAQTEPKEEIRNGSFFGSLGISNRRFNYFTNEDTAFISIRTNDEPITFIYSECKPKEGLDINTYIAYQGVDEWFFSYCVTEAIDKNLRKKLLKYQSKLPSIRRQTKKWLKLRMELESETFFEQRFINEYRNLEPHLLKYIGFPDSLNFLYDNIGKRINGAKKVHGDVVRSISAVADSINTRVNYNLQKWAIILALGALVVALIGDERILAFIRCALDAIYRIVNRIF